MAKRKTILVLTGGGLAPALNPTLYGVISEARKYHYRILGGISGWASLAQHGKIINLTKLNIESTKNRGGDFLRSSRTNPLKVQGGIELLKENIRQHKIDGIIAIGGNDTLKAAAKLYQNEKIPVIGLPKTIDNDLSFTYFSPGFPSAAYFTAKLTAEIKEDAAYALSRVFIIEIMGANAGWLTCASILGGADLVIPPEWEFNLSKILKLVKKKYEGNGDYCVIGLSKEARIKGIKGSKDKQIDGFGKKRKEFISLALQKVIQSKLGLNTKIVAPMNFLQTGMPILLDKKIGVKLGQAGVKLLARQQFGQAAVIDYKNKKFTIQTIGLERFLYGTKKIDTTYFNQQKMLPTKLYLSYLKSLIGNYKFCDYPYQKLQKIITK